jgi:hypothetical protein
MRVRDDKLGQESSGNRNAAAQLILFDVPNGENLALLLQSIIRVAPDRDFRKQQKPWPTLKRITRISAPVWHAEGDAPEFEFSAH